MRRRRCIGGTVASRGGDEGRRRAGRVDRAAAPGAGGVRDHCARVRGAEGAAGRGALDRRGRERERER